MKPAKKKVKRPRMLTATHKPWLLTATYKGASDLDFNNLIHVVVGEEHGVGSDYDFEREERNIFFEFSLEQPARRADRWLRRVRGVKTKLTGPAQGDD